MPKSKMRITIPYLALIAFGAPARDASAFTPTRIDGSKIGLPGSRIITPSSSSIDRKGLSSSNTDDIDCGCASTTFSGKPSDIARNLNPRQAIRNGSIFSLDSEEVRVDTLLEKHPVSIVVFMRSLG